MKALSTGCIFLLYSVFFLSCNKDEKFVPVLNTDKATINAGATAGTETLDITSNVDWDFSGVPAWLKIEPSSGNGNATVRFSYPANANADVLTVPIILNGDGAPTLRLTFSQLGATPSILVDKMEMEELPEGQQDSVVITSNVPWKIVLLPGADWIIPSVSSGRAGVSKFYFTATPNNRVGGREASIRLESTSFPVTPLVLKMEQAQAEVQISSFTPKSKGGATISIKGSGFSYMIDENKVTINGQDATIINASADELKVVVPVGAGSGKIGVTVGTKSNISASDFDYELVWRASTFAGDGTDVPFSEPVASAMGPDGYLYVADKVHQQIKKIRSDGAITTLAGSGQKGFQDGAGTAAMFSDPISLVVDASNIVYVADRNNHRIRKIMPDGSVSTFAGTGVTSVLSNPMGIVLGGDGNFYVSDYGNHRVRKITPAGVMTIFAGSGTAGNKDGLGTAAQFKNPGAITFGNGNIYLAEPTDRRIRKIDNAGNVTTIVNGTGIDPFTLPAGLAVDPAGNIYVADQLRHSIFRITPANAISVIAGVNIPGYKDGEAILAKFTSPSSIHFTANGEMFVTDMGNHMIRKMIMQ